MLAGTQKEGDFSVDCIEEAFQEITCLTELSMEILRTKPELKQFVSNAISCFLVVFEQPCFHVFAEANEPYPPVLEKWVRLLFEAVASCPMLYPHVKELVHKLASNLQ